LQSPLDPMDIYTLPPNGGTKTVTHRRVNSIKIPKASRAAAMVNPLSATQVRALPARDVREARKRLEISQMELAERFDMSAGYVNDIEGSRRWVGAETVALWRYSLANRKLLMPQG
jgi:DNA-binding transcriptional regulator YiaG